MAGWPKVGENVRAGRAILMVEAASKQWLSFNVREGNLGGLTTGEAASMMRNGPDGATKAVITELRPLGVFATRQTERVFGDCDRRPNLVLPKAAAQVPLNLPLR